MTHAAKSHDALERLSEIADEVIRLREEAENLSAKLAAEEQALESRIIITNAAALLRKLKRQSTVSDGDKTAISGLLPGLENVLDNIGRVA